jgi:tetratricopeptide (TPR) repeat protein
MVRLVAALALSALFMGGTAGLAWAQEHVTTNPDPARGSLTFQSDPAGAMRQARSLVAAGDLPGAIKSLATYVVAHPDEVEPQRLLGDLYYRAGDFGRAENVYRTMLVQNPNDKVTHNRLGTVLATEGRIDDAITQFNAALPGTDAIFALVDLHRRKGDFGQYLLETERQAGSFPDDAEAASDLGQVYLALHRDADAEREFRAALDADSQSLTAINGLGVALMDMRQYKEAFGFFERCLQVDRFNYTCLDNTAAAYLEIGNYNKAEEVLDRAVGLDPEEPEAYVNFGYLADCRNDWKSAVNWYIKALAMSPFARDAYFDLGLEYEQHRLFAQAQAVLVKGLAASPQDGGLHVLLGVTYRDLGQLDLARAQFQSAFSSPDQEYATLARQSYKELASAPSAPPSTPPTH